MQRRAVISWALYDFANNIFTMNVVTRYFARWVVDVKGAEDIYYSFAVAASMILAAVTAPMLGTISDETGRRMPYIIVFTIVSCAATALIGHGGGLLIGLALFAVANYCYQISWVFYNALLPQVSDERNIGRISGFGKGLGYCGAIIGLLLVGPFVARRGIEAAFVPSGALFLLFSLPIFFFVRDKRIHASTAGPVQVTATAFNKVRATIAHIGEYSGLTTFFAAAFLALCAIHGIIPFMAVYLSRVAGFTEPVVDRFLIVSTVFALAGSLGSGFLSDRFGPRRTLAMVLVLWCVAFALGALATSKAAFWIVGPLVGIALGATWVVARALVVKLSPPEMVGEAFGFFCLTGYLSFVVGPLVWGGVVWAFGFAGVIKYRLAIGILLLFLLSSLKILTRVPDER